MACREMAHESHPSEFGSGQLPLNMRIATYLASIHNDQIQARAHIEQGSGDSDVHDPMVPTGAAVAESTSAPLTTRAGRTAGRRHGVHTGPRKRRYRDDRQKLSNSLAQKRYRERKKQAFDDMKALVDSLTAEVAQLQYVKRENERLTLEMEEYRNLAELHGVQRMPISNNGSGSLQAESPQSGHAMATPCSSNAPLLPTDHAVQQLYRAQSLEGADWIGTLQHICQCRSSIEMDSSLCLQARIQVLEKDWDERMIAAENVLQLYRLYGGSTDSVSEHNMQPVLKSCINCMSSLNTDITSLKVQHLAQSTQEHIDRIQKAFGLLSLTGDPK